MHKIFTNRWLYISLVAIVISSVIIMMLKIGSNDDIELVTTTVERGPVQQLVSVSGIAEADQTAKLAFPTTGIVRKVLVELGDEVTAGETLITLDARALYADRADASAALTRAVADRDQLISGPTDSARNVTSENIISKQEALTTTKINETQKIENAYRTLLSSGLTAYSDDDNEDSAPPTITGTYSCAEEGAYTVDVFSSNSSSGYSYKLSGIETGTFTVSTEQAIALGKCGLRIKFDSSSKYRNTIWQIEIPNNKSSLYTANKNSHDLALTQAESAIKLAEQALSLAEANAVNQNAPARNEEMARADAAITQAKAKLSRIDSTIADRTLKAPFAGTITNLDILPGETVTIAPVVTLLASGDFEVKAKIPEIDIGKLLVGQVVEMAFDARYTEIVLGDITFISPQETVIDGVSYYEAVIKFRTIPNWIRSGLNADIEVVLTEQTDSLRIPKQFLNETESGHEVLVLKNEAVYPTPVTVTLEGNDGYYAITGINENDILVTP